MLIGLALHALFHFLRKVLGALFDQTLCRMLTLLGLALLEGIVLKASAACVAQYGRPGLVGAPQNKWALPCRSPGADASPTGHLQVPCLSSSKVFTSAVPLKEMPDEKLTLKVPAA